MGDRANVIFKQENGSYLGLYMHNGGFEVKVSTARALERVIYAGRQKDYGYANRIAISDIIGKGWDSNYDYGLNVGATINEAIADNERDVVLVDWIAGNVTVFDFNYFVDSWTVGKVKEVYSFAEFIDRLYLSPLYKLWRLASQEMLDDGMRGSIDCGEASVREDFTAYADLSETISFEAMFKLEKAYVDAATKAH